MFQLGNSVMVRHRMAKLWSENCRMERLSWMVVALVSLVMTGLVSSGQSPQEGVLKSEEQTAEVDAATEEVGALFPVSVFTNQVGVGRDPFFPNSTRRVPKVKKVAPTETAPGKAEDLEGPDLSLFQLKGSFGDVALINGKTIEVGETAVIKTARGEEFTVECIKVTSKTVEIRIQGFPGSHTLYVGGKK